jgi:hypothetical protein
MNSSILFRLPQELRDEIYRYVLHCENGVQFQLQQNRRSKLCTVYGKEDAGWFRRLLRKRREVRWMELNQLKYVCKQLYQETDKLDMLYNCVIFEDTESQDALQRCLRLLEACDALREVAIRCSVPTFQENYLLHKFSVLIQHCQHAGIRARIHIPYWTQQSPNFISIGLYFLYTLRSTSCSTVKIVRSISALTQWVPLRVYPIIPDNIRLFPKEDEFCHKFFDHQVRNKFFVDIKIEEDLTDLRAIVRSWYQDGV